MICWSQLPHNVILQLQFMVTILTQLSHEMTQKISSFHPNPQRFFFLASILTIIVHFVFLYLLCKHTNLKTLITFLALHQLQTKSGVVDALTTGKCQLSEDTIYSYKLKWWTICILIISLLGVAGFLS